MDFAKLLIIVFSLFAGLLTIYVYYWNNLLGKTYIVLSILVLFSLILFDYFHSYDEFFEKYSFNINGLNLIVSIGLALGFAVLLLILSKFYCPLGFALTIPYVKLKLLVLRLNIKYKLLTLLVTFFLISFFDEYLFRGVVYTNLKKEYGPTLALVVEAILYGLYLLPVAMLYFSNVSLMALFIGAIVFAIVLTLEEEKIESLIGPILTHFIFLVLFFIILG